MTTSSFLVTIKDYSRIEKQNGIEDKQPFPIYVSKERYDDCLNLLLLSERVEVNFKGHPKMGETGVVKRWNDDCGCYILYR